MKGEDYEIVGSGRQITQDWHLRMCACQKLRDQKRYSTDPQYLERMASELEATGSNAIAGPRGWSVSSLIGMSVRYAST
jgi:hypothetical protein